MEDKQPLLSICIPTYNRAALLDNVLKLYTQNKYFDERIEIVISDNCSEDNTSDVCKKYTSQFPNVTYYRNSTNLVDGNFAKALSHGKGKYLRLVNDYCYMDDEALLETYEIIKKYSKTNKLLFFYNSCWGITDKFIETTSLDSFVATASNRVTWISNFGCWKEDFFTLDDWNRCIKKQFCQIDWTLRLVSNKPFSVIVNYPLLKQLPIGNTKSGYNFFKVHLDNYFSMYDEYIEKRMLSQKILKMDKHKVLRYWIGEQIVILLFVKNKTEFSFDTSDAFIITFKHYKYSLLYYYYLLIGCFCWVLVKISMFDTIKKILKTILA